MNQKKPLFADFLDWKATYKATPTFWKFLFFFRMGLVFWNFFDLFISNEVSKGTFGTLKIVYSLTQNKLLACGVELLFTFGFLYLSFWFLKQYKENKDEFALTLFGITISSPAWFYLVQKFTT